MAHELIQVAGFKKTKIAAVRTEKLPCSLLGKALAAQDSTYLQHSLWEKGLCDKIGVKNPGFRNTRLLLSSPVVYLRRSLSAFCRLHLINLFNLSLSSGLVFLFSLLWYDLILDHLWFPHCSKALRIGNMARCALRGITKSKLCHRLVQLVWAPIAFYSLPV